jgi:hypothetical protein
MIPHYNIFNTSEESHPCKGHTHHLPLHSLWQILHLNHRNHVHQSRQVPLHILQHSLCMSSCMLISPDPPPMSWKSIWSSRTYICVKKQLLILDTIQKYLHFLFFLKKHKTNEIYKKNSYQYHHRQNLVAKAYLDPLCSRSQYMVIHQWI